MKTLKTINVELPDEIVELFDNDKLDKRLKELAVLELVKERKLTSGKAAEILEISRREFMEIMSFYDIPVTKFFEEKLERQINNGAKTLDEIKRILLLHKQELKEQYKIKSIGIFGSYARGEQNTNSDIDILVEFEKPIGLGFVHLADLLEEILGEKVDLVSRGAIKLDKWRYIEQDLIYV